MTVQKAKRTMQLREWAAQIQDRLDSRLTVREWCAEHGLAQKTYYYRLKCVREGLLEAAESQNALTLPGRPVFAALPAPTRGSAAVMVRIGNFEAEIRDGADPETVERVLRTLARL